MPDERVSHDIHVVAHAEVHVGVGRAEIIAVGAFPRMDECPLQVVLRGNLVELFLDESNVLIDQFQGPVDVVGPHRGASRNGAVDGRADIEMVFVGVLEGGVSADRAVAPMASSTAVSKPMRELRFELGIFIRLLTYLKMRCENSHKLFSPVCCIVAIAVNVPDVRQLVFLEIGVDALAHPDQSIFVAAG